MSFCRYHERHPEQPDNSVKDEITTYRSARSVLRHKFTDIPNKIESAGRRQIYDRSGEHGRFHSAHMSKGMYPRYEAR